MTQAVGLVGYGVDTLILNVRYADSFLCPVKRELETSLQQELDQLQAEARRDEQAVASRWAFQNALLFVEPHGAGRQWRWLLTCRLLSIAISRGKFNDIIAQVRFSSEFLWSQAWAGDALSEVHTFLMSVFGEHLHLQVSEVHLCADVVGFDFSQADYETGFVTRVRKNETIYGAGVESVSLDYHRVSSLRFSSHASPISCMIYNKTLEIQQKSHKTWFFDYWAKEKPGCVAWDGASKEKPGCVAWDGASEVWRVEFRFKREFLHNLATPIEGAYDLLDQLQALWSYAAGQAVGGADGLPDGWLRYVVPTGDSNRSRWPVHAAWAVIQAAFTEASEVELGPVVRERVREVSLARGLAAVIGYCSTLAAWLGGAFVAAEADVSQVLHWLYEEGVTYLDEKQRDYLEEVIKKQKRFGLAV